MTEDIRNSTPDTTGIDSLTRHDEGANSLHGIDTSAAYANTASDTRGAIGGALVMDDDAKYADVSEFFGPEGSFGINALNSSNEELAADTQAHINSMNDPEVILRDMKMALSDEFAHLSPRLRIEMTLKSTRMLEEALEGKDVVKMNGKERQSIIDSILLTLAGEASEQAA